MIKNYGLNVVMDIEFPDHYNYTNHDIKKVLKQSKNMNANIITTEKDFFRLNKSQRKNVKFLKIELEIKNKKNLKKILISKL